MDEEYPIAVPWFPLETERLTLREVALSDFDDIHGYAADPEVTRYMVWGPNTPGETRVAMDGWLSQQAVWPRDAVNLAVELRSRRIVIGTIRLEVRDRANRSADFGYTYNRHFWGRGLATEAARAVLSAGFNRLGLHRIWATCDSRNSGSANVLRKLGMRLEGQLRQDVHVRGHWRDTLLFAVLAEEWTAS